MSNAERVNAMEFCDTLDGQDQDDWTDMDYLEYIAAAMMEASHCLNTMIPSNAEEHLEKAKEIMDNILDNWGEGGPLVQDL